MAGNVVTRHQGNTLVAAEAEILRVGMGVGIICTTQKVCGVGRGQASAIVDTQKFRRHRQGVGVGAAAAMLGSMLAGTDESHA